jgi:acyl-coenzyme A thioesterase PaaI-like protein
MPADAATDRFSTDTAVTRVDEDRFQADCRVGWRVIGDVAPNGGYLMAIAARAMAMRAERPHPVTLTAHFLAPPAHGPLEVRTELVRPGGRHRTVAARLVQDGVEQVRLIGTFGDLALADGPSRVLRTPPPWPPAADLADPTHDLGDFPVPEILHRLEHRMPTSTTGWTRGEPSGDGVHGGWCRWPDADRMDVLSLLFVADAYPPAVFDLGVGAAWAPTIELTVQVRDVPAPGWLATRFSTRALTDGYFEEDGEIWDETGRLVAISRQLALVGRRPQGGRSVASSSPT